jgi:hypothetical protein
MRVKIGSGEGDESTNTSCLTRTMGYLNAFPSIASFLLPLPVLHISKLPCEPRDTTASLHYLRHLLTITSPTLSPSLSVTFAFLASSEHPIEQADLTAFALRHIAVV